MTEEKQDILKKQMSKVPIDKDHAVKFYTHMFTVAPQLRVFFKGAETIEPKDIPASERFQKQGQRLLTSVHVLTQIWRHPMIWDAYIRDLVDKHRRFKGIEYAHYDAFFGVFAGYLEKVVGPASAAELDAWAAFKKDFLEALQRHLNET